VDSRIEKNWKAGDAVDLTSTCLSARCARIPGCRKIAGGGVDARPIVYCAESVDNPQGIRQLVVGRKLRSKLNSNPICSVE